MTSYSAVELSNAFDILYNNINSNQSPGIDEYEKSYFFTKAQDELLKQYLFAHTNTTAAGVDGNQKRQIDYSTLITTREYNPSWDNMTPGEYEVTWPEDVLFVLNEWVYNAVPPANVGDQLMVRGKNERQVIPISFDQYNLLRQKPYPYPPKRQVWRRINVAGKIFSIITSAETFDKYVIRYIKYPEPIILEDWDEEDGRTIRGKNTVTLPILPIQMQEELIQLAVEMAKQSYTSMGQMMHRFPENQIVGGGPRQ